VDEDDTEAQKAALVLGRVLLKPLNEAIHETSGASAFDIRDAGPSSLIDKLRSYARVDVPKWLASTQLAASSSTACFRF
jgi:hypothetical protein